LHIKSYKYWDLYLRGRVKTLGSCVLITKEHYETMSEIPTEAIAELSEISKQLETVFNKLFKPVKYNYQMNMNTENHTHFNIFPRYSTPIQYLGFNWTDNGWPKNVGDNLEVDENILTKLVEQLQSQFKAA